MTTNYLKRPPAWDIRAAGLSERDRAVLPDIVSIGENSSCETMSRSRFYAERETHIQSHQFVDPSPGTMKRWPRKRQDPVFVPMAHVRGHLLLRKLPIWPCRDWSRHLGSQFDCQRTAPAEPTLTAAGTGCELTMLGCSDSWGHACWISSAAAATSRVLLRKRFAAGERGGDRPAAALCLPRPLPKADRRGSRFLWGIATSLTAPTPSARTSAAPLRELPDRTVTGSTALAAKASVGALRDARFLFRGHRRRPHASPESKGVFRPSRQPATSLLGLQPQQVPTFNGRIEVCAMTVNDERRRARNELCENQREGPRAELAASD